MTQFGPPPLPATYAPANQQRSGPPPWSASAIGAFVLSLLGWIGITAILALIFGVVGIFATSDGKRRGRGLAIAAIPISVVTGAVAVVVVLLAIVSLRMVEVPKKLESVFVSGDIAAQTSRLRMFAGDKFNQSVSDETLQAWLAGVREQHGTMTGLTLNLATAFSDADDGSPRLSAKGKFVNGEATVRLTFAAEDLWNAKLADVEVDGVSPLRTSPASAPGGP